MKAIRMIITVDSDQVGRVIENLAGLCHIGAFEVVEEGPPTPRRRRKPTPKKKSLTIKSGKRKRRRGIGQEVVALADGKLTQDEVMTALKLTKKQLYNTLYNLEQTHGIRLKFRDPDKPMNGTGAH